MSMPAGRKKNAEGAAQWSPVLALFYCRNVPGGSGVDRRALEKKYGRRIRLFPLPCGGRVEAYHLLRALEEHADAAFLMTCPENACRHFEGNKRARKRVKRAQAILKSIGMEPERIGIVMGSATEPQPVEAVALKLLDGAAGLGPSPVLK